MDIFLNGAMGWILGEGEKRTTFNQVGLRKSVRGRYKREGIGSEKPDGKKKEMERFPSFPSPLSFFLSCVFGVHPPPRLRLSGYFEWNN